MQINELIEILKQYPSQTRAVVAGYEGGFNHVSKIYERMLQLDANSEPWLGQHETANNQDQSAVKVVVLSGFNMVAKERDAYAK